MSATDLPPRHEPTRRPTGSSSSSSSSGWRPFPRARSRLVLLVEGWPPLAQAGWAGWGVLLSAPAW